MRLPKKPLHHKAKERGYARFGGEQVYLGHWPKHQKKPPPHVVQAFNAAVAEWMANHPAGAEPESPSGAGAPRRRTGRQLVSVDEIWLAYRQYVERRHVKDGAWTSEVHCKRSACRVVARLYGTTPAVQFGPAELLAVRAEMVKLGWTRDTINKAVGRVRQMFKWAAKVDGGGELIPMRVYHRLCEVDGLEEGQRDANGVCPPEGAGVGAVDLELVRQTQEHLSPIVSAMVDAQYLMGCRPQDVTRMRPCDLDRNADAKGGLWLYRPKGYKTQHLDGRRLRRKAAKETVALTYWIVAKAQEILMPLILKAGGWESKEYIFTTAGQRGRRSDSRGCYTTGSYRRAIARGCDRLFPAPAPLGRRKRADGKMETDEQRVARLTPAQREQLLTWQAEHGWTPHQLRHTRMTNIRDAARRKGRGGTEVAQRAVGQQQLSTAEIYAEKNREEQREIMEEFG